MDPKPEDAAAAPVASALAQAVDQGKKKKKKKKKKKLSSKKRRFVSYSRRSVACRAGLQFFLSLL